MSLPWSDIDEETSLEDADSVMLLLNGEAGINANKRSTLSTLKQFILAPTNGMPIFSAVDGGAFIPAGDTYYPISGNLNQDGTASTSSGIMEQVAPISGTYRNFTVNITANLNGTNIANKVELLRDGSEVLSTILIPEGGTASLITSPDVININKGDRLSYHIFIAGADGGKISIKGISIATDVVLGQVNGGSAILSGPTSTIDIIDWGTTSFVGTGISATNNTAIYKLSGNIFQINAFIEIVRASGVQPTSLDHQWRRADNEAFDVNEGAIGVEAHPITVDSNVVNSSTPMNVAFVDARTQDVFVRLVADNSVGGGAVSGFSWAQIFSIGASGGISSPLDTKGQIFGFDGTENVAIPESTTNGEILTVDTVEDSGLKFAAPASVDLASGVTGTLPTINGGTGFVAATLGGVLFGNGVGTINVTGAPAIGKFLIGQSSSTPIFATMSGDATINNTGILSLISTVVKTDQGNTFGISFLQNFAQSLMRIPLDVNPTIAIPGDFAIDSTVTDFSHGIVEYFSGEKLGVVSMPIAQFTSPADGNVVAYNATNDEFELVTPSGGGAAIEFTWASSDEDSPLSTGILYTTEAASASKTFSTVVLTLKNAPGDISGIQVDVLQEDGLDANTFTSIFSSKPVILLNRFTSTTGGIFSVPTWIVQRRLQIKLTINDVAFAATGLKVTLL